MRCRFVVQPSAPKGLPATSANAIWTQSFAPLSVTDCLAACKEDHLGRYREGPGRTSKKQLRKQVSARLSVTPTEPQRACILDEAKQFRGQFRWHTSAPRAKVWPDLGVETEEEAWMGRKSASFFGINILRACASFCRNTSQPLGTIPKRSARQANRVHRSARLRRAIAAHASADVMKSGAATAGLARPQVDIVEDTALTNSNWRPVDSVL